MREENFRMFLEVGVSLSAERDFNRLLEKILLCVMDLSNCDAGTLYLLEDGALHFKIMRNNTMNTYTGGDGSDCGLPPVALNRESVCALALLDDRTIRVADVWHCAEYDLTGPMRYDAITGYHTQSMIVVPMRNREGAKSVCSSSSTPRTATALCAPLMMKSCWRWSPSPPRRRLRCRTSAISSRSRTCSTRL